MSPEELIDKLDVKSWIPRVGDLVKRRDNGRPLGAIVGFRLGSMGVMAYTQWSGEAQISVALGIIEPMDITDVIKESGSPVHKALTRILEQDECLINTQK